jgi:hypothetical protein
VFLCIPRQISFFLSQSLACSNTSAFAEKTVELFIKATSAENASTLVVVTPTDTTVAETTDDLNRFRATAAASTAGRGE